MFTSVVELYRALGRPSFDQERSFSYTGNVDDKTLQLIDAAVDFDWKFGTYEILSRQPQLVLEGTLPNGSGGLFHLSLESFVSDTPSLVKGILPPNFYIRDLDYSTGDEHPPAEILNLQRIITFISLLARFAEDSSNINGSDSTLRLVFVLPPDGRNPQRTIIVPISLERKCLDYRLEHLSLLRHLVEAESSEKLHVEERRLVLKLAIADVLNDSESGSNMLTQLVLGWREIRRKYTHNFQAYINKFSFDDVRRKLAETEIDFASKLSAVLSDISGKLLAIPISLAALIPLASVDGTLAFWIGCAGIVMVSSIYFLVIVNQRLQVKRLKQSYDMIFDPFFSKIDTYPSVLKKIISERRSGYRSQTRFLKTTFYVFTLFALIPILGVLVIIINRYPVIYAASIESVSPVAELLKEWIKDISSRLIRS